MAKKIIDLENFYKTCTIEENQLNTKILYTKTKSGKTSSWQGHVICTQSSEQLEIGNYKREIVQFNNNCNGVFYTTYRLTEDGKLNVSAPTIIKEGTNKGRKNATTPFQQALSKILTKYNDKIKDGATDSKDKLITEISFEEITKRDIEHPNRINVMALHDVKKFWNKVKFPCYVQPKLDGMHVIANCYNGELDLFSRGMSKKISQNHIRDALKFLCEPEWHGFYITGEIWDSNINRQNISSIFGQEQDENVKIRIPLHVFDVFSVNKQLTFPERYELAIKAVKKADSEYIKLVEAKLVNDREELESFYQSQIEIGMEGIVIRQKNSLYEFGVQKEIRSYGTMKYKPRPDSEFLIVGYKKGSGKFSNSIIFIAETETGAQFSVSPKWTMEEREQALKVAETYIGKMATIAYDTLSDKGVPVQPVLIAFV